MPQLQQRRLAVKPIAHTGDSANIAYYTETGKHLPGAGVWAEVLRSDHYWTGSGRRRVIHDRKNPVFHVKVRRESVQGNVAEATYRPRSPSAPGPPG